MPYTNPIILLTGQPRVGKTSIIIRLVNKLKDLAGGFYTKEIRSDCERVGFQIITLNGRTAQLATSLCSVKFKRMALFGKYIINLDSIDNFAIPAIKSAIEKEQIVIIDEIGPMELLSKAFVNSIDKLLDSDCVVVGTIAKRSNHFTNMVKSHPRVILKEVDIDNRENLPVEIYRCLMKCIKAY